MQLPVAKIFRSPWWTFAHSPTILEPQRGARYEPWNQHQPPAAEKRLSQGDLAEVLEVSRQSVSKWETDSSVPDLDKLIKLSQLFGVTLVNW